MSNGVLLAIISCERDNPLVERHWPWFLKAEAAEIVGCGTVDNKCEWPEPIRTLNRGIVGLKPLGTGTSIWGLCQLELDIIAAFLQTDHHSLAILEADNVVLKPFPRHPVKLILAPILPNLQPSMFSSPCYLSTPRWYCRESGGHILHHGKQMLKENQNEGFCSDRFIAAAAFRARLRVLNYGFSSYPLLGPGETNHEEVFIRDARAAIALGTPTIHGCKTVDQLERILQ